MNLRELIHQVYHEPSLITADAHASIRCLLESRLENGGVFAQRAPGVGPCGEKVESAQMQIIDGIAHIPIGGAIGQKLTPFDRGDGAVDVQDIANELDQAEADPTVTAALLDIDSPGGMVTGTPELADRIEAFTKPCYAFTNGMIASAAYWLAASADLIFCTRSASVGSIGVYLPVFDVSAMYEKRGVKVELIKAGSLKGIGFPGTSLTDTARAHLQQRVDDIYSMFTGHVVRRRGKHVAEDTMQGQTFMADEARGRGLVDGIVNTKSDVHRLLAR